MEAIEEEIAALDAIPTARLVTFLRSADRNAHRDAAVQRALRGALNATGARSRAFRTYRESVVHDRNPILHARMRPRLEAGGALVAIWIAKCPGVLARAWSDGGVVAARAWAVRHDALRSL